MISDEKLVLNKCLLLNNAIWKSIVRTSCTKRHNTKFLSLWKVLKFKKEKPFIEPSVLHYGTYMNSINGYKYITILEKIEFQLNLPLQTLRFSFLSSNKIVLKSVGNVDIFK